MRTLIAGLVLIALGIAGAEYIRRNPKAPAAKTDPAAPADDASGEAKQLEAAPSMKDLTAIDSAAAEPNADTAPISELFASASVMKAADGATSILNGNYKIRELKAGTSFAVVVVEKDKTFALVRVSKEAPPKVLIARKEPISALAVDGESVVWAEGSSVLSVPADGSGGVKSLAHFAKAAVNAVAMSKGIVLASLTPTNADPFSTDANGAIVKVVDHAVTMLASEQIRAHDLLVDGSEAFWVSGYPAWLNRASLDGSFSAKIAERADGPLGLDGDFIVHRYPQTSGPEVRRMARAGGSVQTLARADVDWLAVSGGVVAYTTTGIGSRLYEVKVGSDPVEKAAFKGTAKGVARSSEGTYLLFTNDDGITSVLVY